jgi:hypothetical protein
MASVEAACPGRLSALSVKGPLLRQWDEVLMLFAWLVRRGGAGHERSRKENPVRSNVERRSEIPQVPASTLCSTAPTLRASDSNLQ